MLMIFLYPVACFGVAAVWLAYAWRARSIKAIPSAVTTALLALALAYLISLAIIAIEPYYEDNGATEFIAWPHRWWWAAELAGWLTAPILPVVFGLRALVRYVLRISAIKKGPEGPDS